MKNVMKKDVRIFTKKILSDLKIFRYKKVSTFILKPDDNNDYKCHPQKATRSLIKKFENLGSCHDKVRGKKIETRSKIDH